MKYLLLPLTALMLVACTDARDATRTADLDAIHALQAELARAIDKRDFEAALRCYADDAVLLMPGQPRITGTASIRNVLRAAFASPGVSVDVTTGHVEIASSGDLAFAWGDGLTTMESDAAAMPRTASKWLAVFRRQEGAWKIAADAYNFDEPPPG